MTMSFIKRGRPGFLILASMVSGSISLVSAIATTPLTGTTSGGNLCLQRSPSNCQSFPSTLSANYHSVYTAKYSSSRYQGQVNLKPCLERTDVGERECNFQFTIPDFRISDRIRGPTPWIGSQTARRAKDERQRARKRLHLRGLVGRKIGSQQSSMAETCPTRSIPFCRYSVAAEAEMPPPMATNDPTQKKFVFDIELHVREPFTSIATSSVPSTSNFKTTTRRTPVARDDEPNLHDIPDELHTTYRPLPKIVKLCVDLASLGLAAWAREVTWINLLMSLRAGVHPWNFTAVLPFLVTAIVTSVLTSMVLQDIFLTPSRVQTSTLFDKYFGPSKLSCFKSVALQSGEQVGVHHLLYASQEKGGSHRFGAIYVNHGFTASSLSWLPALPSLVERTGSRVGIGHDAPGFGFTERPRHESNYKCETSAHIGTSLLTEALQKSDSQSDAVLLLGHSMGSLTTLRMALELPRETRKVVVLVSPALGQRPPFADHLESFSFPAIHALRSLDPVVGYFLRRLVGIENIWKDALKILAFSDSYRVSDSDALRFKWPSILHGWEYGVLSFLRAQLLPSLDNLTDVDLFEQVLSLPNTSVAVIHGTSDSVVPHRELGKFLQPYLNDIRLISLEGQAHDPFEENVEMFVAAVEGILRDEGMM